MATILCVTESLATASVIINSLSLSRSQRTMLTQSECSSTRFEMEFENKVHVAHCLTITEPFFQYQFNESVGKNSPEEFLLAGVKSCLNEQRRSAFCELVDQSRSCDTVLLFMNYSENSELICLEIERICRSVKSNMNIVRVHFHSLLPLDICQAVEQNKGVVNHRHAFMKQLEIILNLRFSKAFSPLFVEQGKLYIKKRCFALDLDPFLLHALGLVVDHCQKHQYTEPKYALHCCTKTDTEERHWKWKRKALFCKISTFALYADLLAFPGARVISKTEHLKIIKRPLPLNGALLACLSEKHLNLDPKMTVALAMSLYEKGLISFPLTECQCFPRDFPFKSVFARLVGYEPIARQAAILRVNYAFPESGPRGFENQIPIYPCKCPCDCSDIDPNSNEMKLYDLIVKHFMACCMKDSCVSETVVELDVGGEIFYTKYKTSQELNWLSVFDYASDLVVKQEVVPTFQVDDDLHVKSVKIAEVVVKENKGLPQYKLFEALKRFGLEAVLKADRLVSEGLVRKVADGVKPTPLGLGIVYSFMSLGFDLSDPFLPELVSKVISELEEGETEKIELVLRAFTAIHRELSRNKHVLGECFVRAFEKLPAFRAK